jgi:hypothetical protein
MSAPLAAAATPTIRRTGLYLYAVVPEGTALDAAGLDGVPVEVTSGPRVGLVVSRVDTEQLSAGLRSADVSPDGWLAAAVRAHDSVVTAACAAGPAVPLRFGTVVADESVAAELARTHEARLCAELDRLGGAEEWELRAVRAVPGTPVDPAPPRAGKEYLTALRDRRRAAQGTDSRLVERLAQLDKAAASLARAAAVAAGPAGSLWAARYLVPISRRPAFLQLVGDTSAAIGEQEGRLECSGPWPPYSFATVRLGTSE